MNALLEKKIKIEDQVSQLLRRGGKGFIQKPYSLCGHWPRKAWEYWKAQDASLRPKGMPRRYGNHCNRAQMNRVRRPMMIGNRKLAMSLLIASLHPIKGTS